VETPLPEGLTLHALRRTCASVLVALGKDPRYVMAQLGHTDPTVTLGIYAQAMTSSDHERERLRLLVEGADLMGPNTVGRFDRRSRQSRLVTKRDSDRGK
jgi:integrase